MKFVFEKYPKDVYSLLSPNQIATPRLLVFRRPLEKNINTMRQMLQTVCAQWDMDVLCPHVKTHKSSWVTQRLAAAGVHWFKCSPNELDMLIAVKVPHVFLAYPLLSNLAEYVAEKSIAHPQTELYVQISKPEHVDILSRVGEDKNIQWRFFIDLDVGMNRTGIKPQDAYDFYLTVVGNSRLAFAGLHAYDGHNHLPTLEERRSEARRAMKPVVEAVRQFHYHHVQVPRLIVGGTPSFLPDAEYLCQQQLPGKILLSPGTWIYFDSTYGNKMPDTFIPAALILCQVMDRLEEDLFTLNLGHKRWAVDQGAVELFSISGMTAVKWSEEHTVVRVPPKNRLKIGDYVLLVPKHVCSTVNLWEYFTLIDGDGNIEMERCAVDARNR